MKWRRLVASLSMEKSNKKIRKRKDLEKELCKRIKIINEKEEELLQLWDNLEELSSRHERKTQLWIAVKERHERATKERQLLTEEIQRLQNELKRALVKRMETLKTQIELKWRVKQLKKQKAAIERKCEMLWEMTFCLDQREEKREWRENLRRTRSQNDMVKHVPQPSLGRVSPGQDLLRICNWQE